MSPGPMKAAQTPPPPLSNQLCLWKAGELQKWVEVQCRCPEFGAHSPWRVCSKCLAELLASAQRVTGRQFGQTILTPGQVADPLLGPVPADEDPVLASRRSSRCLALLQDIIAACQVLFTQILPFYHMHLPSPCIRISSNASFGAPLHPFCQSPALIYVVVVSES